MMEAVDNSQAMTERRQAADGQNTYGSSGHRVRQITYLLLIVLTVGMVAGRILAVTAVDVAVVEKIRLREAVDRQREQLKLRGVQGANLEAALQEFRAKKSKELRLSRPFLSANDRSRWCTIRALVDDGTYAIDQIVTNPEEYARWQTIDMVKHASSGQPHLYSSKPTLLPTLLAGEYFLIQKNDRMDVGRAPVSSGQVDASVDEYSNHHLDAYFTITDRGEIGCIGLGAVLP